MTFVSETVVRGREVAFRRVILEGMSVLTLTGALK